MNYPPQVPEQLATGEVARLYADIRMVTRVPLVSLVYRYLATDVNVPEWTWGALRPKFVSGAIDRDADQIQQVAELIVGQWSLAHFVPTDDYPAAAAIISAYSVANRRNLVALNHLLGRGCRGVRERSIDLERSPANLPELAVCLPPIALMEHLAAPVAERVRRLDRFAERSGSMIVPSLFRHLAHCPDALEAVELCLTPLETSGALLRAAETLAAITSATASTARPLLTSPPATFRAFEPTLKRFASVTIPKIVPICTVLRRLFRSAS